MSPLFSLEWLSQILIQYFSTKPTLINIHNLSFQVKMYDGWRDFISTLEFWEGEVLDILIIHSYE